jgi:hypothetical protein
MTTTQEIPGDALDGGNSTHSENKKPKFNKDPRFWAIIATLCVIGILSALENTVVTTSLPFIVTKLDLGDNYVWVTNVFFLTRYLHHVLSLLLSALTRLLQCCSATFVRSAGKYFRPTLYNPGYCQPVHPRQWHRWGC